MKNPVLLTVSFLYSLFTKTFLLIEFKTTSILHIYENIQKYTIIFSIYKNTDTIEFSKMHEFLLRLQP